MAARHQVIITKGSHRNQPVSGTFTLLSDYKEGSKGGFIIVKSDGNPIFRVDAPRIMVERGDFQILDATGEALPEGTTLTTTADGKIDTTSQYEQMFTANETEEEAMERISDTFAMLDTITDACARMLIRGLVVSGPPGIGKSFGVEKQLEAANMFRKLKGKDPRYEVVSGGVSPIGLYQKLYLNRSPDQVLVFDDCDGILFDEECLNLLKAALNSGDKRRICWNKESRVLQAEDIPESFDFEASIIFLSNIDFEKTIERGSRIAAHLSAIMSRCHYLDLEVGSQRDKLLRIKQIVRDGMLDPYDFTKEENDAIINFVFENADYLRELSLRMVKKIADFVKADPRGWYEMAEATCLTREAKFKRLLDRKAKAKAEGKQA
jgi:hypothetical protein